MEVADLNLHVSTFVYPFLVDLNWPLFVMVPTPDKLGDDKTDVINFRDEFRFVRAFINLKACCGYS
jgi:hypothetical protein